MAKGTASGVSSGVVCAASGAMVGGAGRITVRANVVTAVALPSEPVRVTVAAPD